MQQRSEMKNDIFISKTLSYILRHGALNAGFSISSSGYVPVKEILAHKTLRGKCTMNDIERVVSNNNKQRFTLRLNEDNDLEIKANQGHSLNCVTDLDLEPITDPNEYENVIHGTYFNHWSGIRKNGISRMKRLHIHFATGLPSDKRVISGIRQDVDVYIYIDLRRALEANIKFYKSANGVILSPGNENGFLEAKYFLKVCNSRDGTLLSV